MRFSLIAILITVALARADAPLKGEFLERVQANFKAWDTDADRKLSVNEIERALANPKIKGKDAAAVAALRRGMKATRTINRSQWTTFARSSKPKPRSLSNSIPITRPT